MTVHRSAFFDFIESTSKIIGSLLVILAVLAFLIPPIETAVKMLTAWRFGAEGVVKYELGTDEETGERVLTIPGQLYLLEEGPREFVDVAAGDIVQAASTVRFRDGSACVETKDCGSSAIVFLLKRGDCAIVLSKAYDDSGPDTDKVIKRKGGWLRVATTTCGLFE